MSRESDQALNRSLEALAKSDAFVAPAVRRAMELRLLSYGEGELEPDTEEPSPPTDPDELAVHIVELLRSEMAKGEHIWEHISLPAIQDEKLGELETTKELRSMVESYLELGSDDPEFLERQHGEILEQKVRFADAVIEEWIKDLMIDAFKQAQEKKIRKMLGGKAIRLTPITRESITEWLNDGTPPDELFCEGYPVGVSIFDGVAALSMGGYPDWSGPVTDAIPVWRHNSHTGELVQEAKLEVIEASEVRR